MLVPYDNANKITELKITGIFSNKIAENYVLNPWPNKKICMRKKQYKHITIIIFMSIAIIPLNSEFKDAASALSNKLSAEMPTLSYICQLQFNRSLRQRILNANKLGFDNIVKITSNDGTVQFGTCKNGYDTMTIDEFIELIKSYDFEDDDDSNDENENDNDNNKQENETKEDETESNCSIC